MKNQILQKLVIASALCLLFLSSYTQAGNTGKAYFSWGWNRAAYTDSDIHFKGENYDFKLESVKATDRPSSLNLDTYFNPINISIPQTNFRIGYFFNDQYEISFGMDHMKYVVEQNQTVKISGYIREGSEYDGTYEGNDIEIKEDFLKFEHTDGLNYCVAGLSHHNNLFEIEGANMAFSFVKGVDIGVLIPKSDVTVLGNRRENKFNLSGYGVAVKGGIHVSFLERGFFQTELKVGAIHMSDIYVRHDSDDRASQRFSFVQANIVFGMLVSLE